MEKSHPDVLTSRDRVITVRLTAEMHERLKMLAHAKQVSLNGLCVAALRGMVRQNDKDN